MLKVIGHITPDTDSTCSPIVYAWYLNEIKKIEAKAFISGDDLNKETEFVLDRFGILKPESLDEFSDGDELVIIDTNNPDELLPGIEKATIVELIDHHKLSGLTTSVPLRIVMEPLACSATVLWDVMHCDSEDLFLPVEMAGLLQSAIISDTLNLSSPTTTDKDRDVLNKLSEITGISNDELAAEMFAAKSDLTGMSAEDLILMDSKVYEFAGKKVRMSVLETTAPEKSLEMEGEIEGAVSRIKNEQGLDMVFFFVVDIVKNNSTLLVFADEEKEIAEKAFDKEPQGNQFMLEGVVSRKKQMVPAVEKSLGN